MDSSIQRFGFWGVTMGNSERSPEGGRDDWRVRVSAMVGVAACMTLALIFGPMVGVNGFRQGILAMAGAIIVGGVLGRLLGGKLFRPAVGGTPDHPPRT